MEAPQVIVQEIGEEFGSEEGIAGGIQGGVAGGIVGGIVGGLRSIPLLDRAAIAAVKQWRYSPLLLNGRPERFVLTVTVSFSLNT
jgi:hypothetical protein